MTLSHRARRATTVSLLALGLTVTGATGSAQAAPQYGDDFSGEDLYYCFISGSCHAWQDSAEWALSVAEWKYPESLRNGKGDAFRHCAWSGALANRVSYDDAYTLVIIHEDLERDPMPEVNMDITNDIIGLDIGMRSRAEGGDDQWGWILNQCESRAEAGELAGLDGVLGSY